MLHLNLNIVLKKVIYESCRESFMKVKYNSKALKNVFRQSITFVKNLQLTTHKLNFTMDFVIKYIYTFI